MSLTLKLLGPDVPQGFSLTVDASLTVTQVQEKLTLTRLLTLTLL